MKLKRASTSLLPLLVLAFVCLLNHCKGVVVLTASPNPARIFQGAPPGVPVLTCHGYDNNTGLRVGQFRLVGGGDARYFMIDSDGVVSTSLVINFPVGRVFEFLLGASLDKQDGLERVKVIVSLKNRHPPRFSSSNFTMLAYRFGLHESLGQLNVTDLDVEPYNNQFVLRLDYQQRDSAYVEISPDFHLRLTRQLPEQVSSLNLTVFAMDMGSPQFTSSAQVIIHVVKTRKPNIFCVAATESSITLCWKNPMPELTFEGYNLTVFTSYNRTYFIPAMEGHSESCFTEDKGANQSYAFNVVVQALGPSYGTDYHISVNHRKIGHAKSCESEKFSICNYRDPCNGHGECSSSTASQFECRCQSGWRGESCQIEDLCAGLPCQNGGRCEFLGHKLYRCDCQVEFYGSQCQHYNHCLDQPCLHGGSCLTLEDGHFRCQCLSAWAGDKCENTQLTMRQMKVQVAQTTNPCEPDPCPLRQSCRIDQEQSQGYTCVCLPDYHGDSCQWSNQCLDLPCQYQGTCIPVNNTFVCQCPRGKTGQVCEVSDPCSFTPCMNNGTCSRLGTLGDYLCACPPLYVGRECQYFNYCQGLQCGNGTCQLIFGRPRCECSEGYYGERCQAFDVCLTTSVCNSHGSCNSFGSSPDYRDNFSCTCQPGYVGPDCATMSRCSPTMCKNGGTCVPVAGDPNRTRCACLPGYYLDDCSALDPCFSDPCLNKGECRNLNQGRFSCNCSKDYMGELCQLESPCHPTRNPCLNNGQCSLQHQDQQNSSSPPDASLTLSPFCNCTLGFVGSKCEVADPCLSSPCLQGKCLYVDSGVGTGQPYLCNCHQNFTGSRCEVPVDPCQAHGCLNDGFCSQGDCVCPFKFSGRYCEIEIDPCEVSVQAWGCASDDGLNSLRGLLDYTSDPSKLTAVQVMNYTDQLMDLFNYTLRDPQYAWTAFSVLGNLARVNLSVSLEAELNDSSSTRLRQFVDSYASQVRLGDTGQLNISAPELQVKVISLTTQDLADNFTVTYQPYVTDGNQSTSQIDLSISIPGQVLASSPTPGPTRVQLIGFKRSQLFVPATGFSNDEAGIPHQPVISATVKDRFLENLTVPVEIKLSNVRIDGNYTCVFWDQDAAFWSTEGVSLHSTQNGTITCHSTHLTSFAILLNVNERPTISEQHQQILTYLTYIGCAISTSCLVVTIFTYTLFKCLNSEKSGKILLNLCTALVLLNVSFLVATVDVTGYSNQVCLAVALLLHYFLLASLTWMLVEALEMYQALVTVFSKYERFYLLKRCLFAWGVPVIVVAITGGINSHAYYQHKDTEQICFLTSASETTYYSSLMAPACLVILVNILVFIRVARVILRPNFQQQLAKNTTSITPAQVRGAFTVMFLLGITWVFGPLAIEEAQTFFSYLFCITNSLQGFLIFVFRCIFNPEVKLAWLQLLYTGTLKRKRGPIPSISTSDWTSKGGGDQRRYSTTQTSAGYTGTSRSALARNGTSFKGHPHNFQSQPQQLHSSFNGWHPNLNGLRRETLRDKGDNSVPSHTRGYSHLSDMKGSRFSADFFGELAKSGSLARDKDNLTEEQEALAQEIMECLRMGSTSGFGNKNKRKSRKRLRSCSPGKIQQWKGNIQNAPQTALKPGMDYNYKISQDNMEIGVREDGTRAHDDKMTGSSVDQTILHDNKMTDSSVDQTRAHDDKMTDSSVDQTRAHDDKMTDSSVDQTRAHDDKMTDSSVDQTRAHDDKMIDSSVDQTRAHDDKMTDSSVDQTRSQEVVDTLRDMDNFLSKETAGDKINNPGSITQENLEQFRNKTGVYCKDLSELARQKEDTIAVGIYKNLQDDLTRL